MRTILLSCVLLSGCIAEEAPPPDQSDQSDPADQAAPPDRARIDVPPELQLQTEHVPIASDYISDCVYIQWCNKPNSPERISCILKSRCVDVCNTQQGRDEVVSECQNEAEAVCGTKNYITYHGCNGLGPP